MHLFKHIISQQRAVLRIAFQKDDTSLFFDDFSYRISLIAVLEGLIISLLINYFQSLIPEEFLQDIEVATTKVNISYYVMFVTFYYLLSWSLQIGTLYLSTSFIKISNDNFKKLITAYNWSIPIHFSIILFPSVFFALPILTETAFFTLLIAYIFAWYIKLQIFRNIFNTSFFNVSILVSTLIIVDFIAKLFIHKMLF